MKLQQQLTHIALVALLTLVSMSVAHATSITIESHPDVTAGTAFSLHIIAQGEQNIFGVELLLAYDERLVELQQIRDGTVLSDAQQEALVVTRPDTDFLAVRLSSHNPKSSGLLAVADFVARTPGTVDISIQHIIVVNENGTEIPSTTSATSVTITPQPVRIISGGGGSTVRHSTPPQELTAPIHEDTIESTQPEAPVQEDPLHITREVVNQQTQLAIDKPAIPTPPQITGAVPSEYDGPSHTSLFWVVPILLAGLLGISAKIISNKTETDDPVINYITQMRTMGYTDEITWKQLQSVGWNEEIIFHSFIAVEKQQR